MSDTAAKREYDKLQSYIAGIERATGAWLADEGCDRENVPAELEDDSDEFWAFALRSAVAAFRGRAEEQGIDPDTVDKYLKAAR